MNVITETINNVLLLNNAMGVSAGRLSTAVMDQLQSAVNAACNCGGKQIGEGCCPACEVWHRLSREVRK